MKKNYIGTLELNNGGVVVGNAKNTSCAFQITNMPKGVYHCYTYNNNEDGGDGRRYVGIEYGASLDNTNDFEEFGVSPVLDYGGIFDMVYYLIYKGVVGGQKTEEQLKILNDKWTCKLEETNKTPIKLIDNRGLFFNTNNCHKKQDAVVYVRKDKKQSIIEIKIGYFFEFEMSDSQPEIVNNMVDETTYECKEFENEVVCDEITEFDGCNSFDNCANEETCGPVETVCDEWSVACAECDQEFFTHKADVVVNDVKEEPKDEEMPGFTYNENKHKIEKLYFSLNGTTIGGLVIPKFNEVIKELIGNHPGLHWYRGMTVEKLDGKIHKLIIDFD